MDGAVRPYTYGVDWVLVDPDTGRRFDAVGTTYAKRVLRRKGDDRPLAQAGIEGDHLVSAGLEERHHLVPRPAAHEGAVDKDIRVPVRPLRAVAPHPAVRVPAHSATLYRLDD